MISHQSNCCNQDTVHGEGFYPFQLTVLQLAHLLRVEGASAGQFWAAVVYLAVYELVFVVEQGVEACWVLGVPQVSQNPSLGWFVVAFQGDLGGCWLLLLLTKDKTPLGLVEEALGLVDCLLDVQGLLDCHCLG